MENTKFTAYGGVVGEDGILRFVKLPPKNKPGTRPPRKDHVRLAEELKKTPGEWVPFCQQDYKTSSERSNAKSRIQKGVYAAFRPAGHFEAAARQGTLYVRYVGEA